MKIEQLWTNFNVNINSISQIPEFANPYFLGFGNPDSDLLFIGKEKAFDIYKNPKSFLHESFNNTLQWKLIDENKFDKSDSFDPRNPRKYHTKKIKSNHTWGKYAQIITGIKDLDSEANKRLLEELLAKYSPVKDSLFNHCFMTEINHIPSKYSIGHNLIEERKSLLKDPFYKSFKNVVIGAKGYLKTKDKYKIDGIEELFEVKHQAILNLDFKRNEKPITASIYRSKAQQIIYCQQLSGASGWTNKAIDKLVELIKENQR